VLQLKVKMTNERLKFKLKSARSGHPAGTPVTVLATVAKGDGLHALVQVDGKPAKWGNRFSLHIDKELTK
jgi:hypothetical protein